MLPRSIVARAKVGAQLSALNCPALKSRVTKRYTQCGWGLYQIVLIFKAMLRLYQNLNIYA